MKMQGNDLKDTLEAIAEFFDELNAEKKKMIIMNWWIKKRRMKEKTKKIGKERRETIFP